MSSVARWDQKLKRFVSTGTEPFDLGGRVVRPVNPDSELTIRLEVRPPTARARRYGTAALPQVTDWRLFRRRLADWLERLANWIRPN